MNKNFIKCSDPTTIAKLKSLGFQLLQENSGIATFINNTSSKFTFDEDIKNKIVYTNRITV